MKKYVVLLVVCVFVGFWVVNLTYAVSAAELWYPGGPGSSWVYKTTTGSKIEARVVDDAVVLDSIRYRVVKETSLLAGYGDDSIIDPFLTFRVDGQNRILSYGKDANENLKDVLVDGLIEVFGGLIGEDQIQVSSLYNEWVLFDANVGPNGTWTVMRTRTTVNLENLGLVGLEDFIEIREINGRIGPLTPMTITTKDGPKVFQAYELHYSYLWRGEGGGNDEVDEDVEELHGLILVPGIGAVRVITMPGKKENNLFEYQILPLEQSVLAGGKTVTTWASLKTR